MQTNFFAQAMEKQALKKEQNKTFSGRIKRFAEKEQPNRKSIEHRELKRKLAAYVRLICKAMDHAEDPENLKDPIETAFSRLNGIVGLLRDMGQTEKLEEYMFLLTNLDVKVRDPEPIVKDVAGLDELVKTVRTNVSEADGLSEEIKKIALGAEKEGVCSAARFPKLLKVLKEKSKNGVQSAEDKLQEEYLFGTLVSGGADAVSELIK